RTTASIAAAIVGLIFVVVCAVYFRQHSMLYHPRRYGAGYDHVLPQNGVEIGYKTASGSDFAYFIATGEGLPRRVWFAFCGNGSLALDWLPILADYPKNGDAFLLVDYPGYGKNAGYAGIESTRACADGALHALSERLRVPEDELPLCAIGHSMGSAVALDFAVRHHASAVLLIAPFTTLREEAATVVGGLLSHLLSESYDNRSALARLAMRNPRPRIAIFHGTDDKDIPIRMGSELAREYPFVEFFPVQG